MKTIIKILVPLVFCGCAAAKFKAPEVEMPEAYLHSAVVNDSVVEYDWWRSFGDSVLCGLVDEALENNYDIKTAVSKLTEAQLQLKQARAGLAPVFGLGIDGSANYTQKTKIIQRYSIQPTLSWEIDLFGKLRYAAVAERAEMFATEENLRAVRLAIAAEVATAYFSILQYDLSYRIAQKTLESRKESSELIALLAEYGVGTQLEIEQNNSLIWAASVAMNNYRMARDKAVMSFAALLGRNPEKMEMDGERLLSYGVPSSVPGGLPASLLERRPDIMASYYGVEASYATIGVAIASRLPSLTLTGSGGLLSSTLNTLFNGEPFAWSAALSLTQPLLAFGRNKRAVDIAKEQQKQALYDYNATVITALGEVESALVSIEYLRKQIDGQRELISANKEYQDLTRELFNAGEENFLSVLDAEREYFSSQLSYASLLSSELTSYVTLYKALGGGIPEN